MSAPLALDWQSSPAGLPLFQRIAEAITRDIRGGRLQAGQRLPSSRALAKMLDVHRNTALAAYDELEAQGFVETKPARGTFITQNLPQRPKSEKAGQKKEPVPLRLAPPPRKVDFTGLPADSLPLVGGLPDLRSTPLPALARAYRSALRETPESLDYQSPYGQPRFLKVFSQYLAESRGVVAGDGEMLVTRGSQQALHLAAKALWRPGSVIAVERAGYPPAWEGFRMAGAELVPIRTDKNGLVVDELARLCEQRDVAAVYTTPHHQYPTTVTMSGPRRMALLSLAAKKKFVVIEDDYDHEYHFDTRPVLPLAHMDERGVVLHIGTLSKVFAPGLRLGYAVGQASLIEAMMSVRNYLDRQGDHVTELALAYMIEDGELGAHIRRMHRTYEVRREILFDELRKRVAAEISFDRPSGGLALWTRVSEGISAKEWAEVAAEEKVIVQPAQYFFFDRRNRPYLRMGYARLDEGELKEAVKRLAKACRRL